MQPKQLRITHARTLDLTYTALFTALMAVCAWISAPGTPVSVPFTFQTFAVFAALTMLGGRRGTWAITAYLLLGLAGMPVFAGFHSGAGVLLGATGGYLVGFIGTGLAYGLVTRFLGQSLPAVTAACLLGMAVYYVFGTVWFLEVYARTTGPIGLTAALGWCVIPFLAPDLLKMALAILLSRRLGRYLPQD